MTGVLTGFLVIVVVIGVGYALGVSRVLGAGGERTLSLLVFYVATPALLFTTLVTADLAVVFSHGLLVSAATALTVGALYWPIARRLLGREIPETVIGALASSYVNSANLGIPIAVYVLGDLTVVAPLLLFQIVLYSPIALTILDVSTLDRSAPRTRLALLTHPLRNPIVLAAIAGLAVSIAGVRVPAPLLQPIELLAGASVPCALLAFGVSLHGVRILRAGTSPRRDIAVVTVLKLAVQPVFAWALGRFALGLDGHELLAVTVVAALPTAQNVFTYASRYRRGVTLARDAAVVTTAGAVPAIALIVALLG